jgi:dTDP-4-dehydrorhamnose reductase
MKILLTGKGGQLGSHFAESIAGTGAVGGGGADGFELVGLDSHALDITDNAKVCDVIERLSPALILNCAAYTLVDEAEIAKERAYAVNRDGPRNLAKAAKKAGAALVHISTDFVFDGKKASPYLEEDAIGPLGAYGASKLAGEVAVAAAIDEFVIVRTSWLYGSRGGNFVKTILKLAEERERLEVVYDQAGTPTSAADLAGALARIAWHVRALSEGEAIDAPWGVYHYSNEGVASRYDFAVAIVEEARALGVPLKCAQIEPVLTATDAKRAIRPAYAVLGKEKIKKAFGLKIPHWRGSLRTMIKTLYGGSNA